MRGNQKINNIDRNDARNGNIVGRKCSLLLRDSVRLYFRQPIRRQSTHLMWRDGDLYQPTEQLTWINIRGWRRSVIFMPMTKRGMTRFVNFWWFRPTPIISSCNHQWFCGITFCVISLWSSSECVWHGQTHVVYCMCEQIYVDNILVHMWDVLTVCLN